MTAIDTTPIPATEAPPSGPDTDSQSFLLRRVQPALSVAIIVVALELLTLAYLRHKFFHTGFARSFVAVAVGGAIIASLSAGLGVLAAG
jgi:hypothetical protein